MKTYKIKAMLSVTYTLKEENKEDALAVAKDLLLQKIDKRDVAYDELKGIIVEGEVDELHKMYKGRRVAIEQKSPCYCDSIFHANGC